MNRILVDTNVLVYAYDPAGEARQEQALKVLNELAVVRRGVLTAQVLAEFAVVAFRKLDTVLPPDRITASVQHYLRSWPVLDITGLIILEAIRGVKEHKMSYWDAQIWASAHLNQIPAVFSEDFASGSTVEGVAFINPFNKGFQLTDWV
jgi:predicted nucleic acid-binding protein